jgi:hypothetical protein
MDDGSGMGAGSVTGDPGAKWRGFGGDDAERAWRFLST